MDIASLLLAARALASLDRSRKLKAVLAWLMLSVGVVNFVVALGGGGWGPALT